MPAAIPEPDQRPPLTAHTQQAHTTTPPPTNRNTATRSHCTDQNNIAAQITLQQSPQQFRKRSPPENLPNIKTKLDNAPEVGHNKDAATNKPRTSWETGNQ